MIAYAHPAVNPHRGIAQRGDGEQADNRYRVNDFVTREGNSGAPVVYEDNPEPQCWAFHNENGREK